MQGLRKHCATCSVLAWLLGMERVTALLLLALAVIAAVVVMLLRRCGGGGGFPPFARSAHSVHVIGGAACDGRCWLQFAGGRLLVLLCAVTLLLDLI